MIVIKRDFSTEPFDFSKITSAVTKAFEDTQDFNDTDARDTVLSAIEQYFEEKEKEGIKALHIEDIQDTIEDMLIEYNNIKVAKSYITYRYEHNLLRRNKNSLVKAIESKLGALNVENQNANSDEYSFGGRMAEASRIVLKEFALENCMSKKSARLHRDNEIYIHDLDSYALGMHNCLSIPFDDLLKNGFTTRQVDIRPARSVSTAFQLVAVIFQLQSLQQFGGCSATHIDWTMVPYVRLSFRKYYAKHTNKDARSIPEDTPIDDNRVYDNSDARILALEDLGEEIRQAVEGLYHNLNSLQSRSGNQLPFTSLNYGTCTLVEGQYITGALLKGSINGVGRHHITPIFPCGIFQCMKGINQEEGDPNYYLFKLALESTAKRLYPNYANVDWSGNAGYDPKDPRTYFSTMGCRTANGYDVNGFGQLKDGRGNICPVTIILPTIAEKANRDLNTFMQLLDSTINSAKDMLLERFEWIAGQSPKSASFMWDNKIMAGYKPEDGIISALRHGTLAIGQLGLSECLKLLIGEDHTTKHGMVVAKKIEELFKTKCTEFKHKYKLNFGVYYTPAENLCHTAMIKFQEEYGIIPGVSDKKYFTNSMHIPVDVEITPFEKIDLESQLTGYSSAGCITYVELDSSVKHNIEGLETIVKYAMSKDIPYFAINIPNDTCKDCGYIDEIGDRCPQCNSDNIMRLRRVTGYLSTDYHHFNYGKQEEVEQRVKHIREIK